MLQKCIHYIYYDHWLIRGNSKPCDQTRTKLYNTLRYYLWPPPNTPTLIKQSNTQVSNEQAIYV